VKRRIHPKIESALAEARKEGVQAEAVLGSRHIQYRVNGKLVGVSSRVYDDGSQRNAKNTVAQIRRAVRGEKP
jgi:hypothetical protein